jgi:hypothetical protein
MDENKIITATFIESGVETYTLTVNTDGNGSVVKSPNQEIYFEGTVVTLTAVPDADWLFSGWAGDLSGQQNPVQITMNKDYSISATFVRGGMGESLFLPFVIKP